MWPHISHRSAGMMLKAATPLVVAAVVAYFVWARPATVLASVLGVHKALRVQPNEVLS